MFGGGFPFGAFGGGFPGGDDEDEHPFGGRGPKKDVDTQKFYDLLGV